jgi:hypothetical protein
MGHRGPAKLLKQYIMAMPVVLVSAVAGLEKSFTLYNIGVLHSKVQLQLTATRTASIVRYSSSVDRSRMRCFRSKLRMKTTSEAFVAILDVFALFS